MVVICGPAIDISGLSTWFLLNAEPKGISLGREGSVEGRVESLPHVSAETPSFWISTRAASQREQGFSPEDSRRWGYAFPHISAKPCGMRCGGGIYTPSPSWKLWRDANHNVKVLSSRLQATSWQSQHFLVPKCTTGTEKNYLFLSRGPAATAVLPATRLPQWNLVTHLTATDLAKGSAPGSSMENNTPANSNFTWPQASLEVSSRLKQG